MTRTRLGMAVANLVMITAGVALALGTTGTLCAIGGFLISLGFVIAMRLYVGASR